MAFGQRKQEQETEERESKTFENFRVDLKTPGIRLVRLLPFVDETGNLIDGAGNVSERGETADEVRFAEIWWKFNIEGKEVQRNIITSWAKAYKNPVYDKICELYDDKDTNKPKPRLKFAVNVYDRSPVVITEKGIAIQNDNREFVLADGSKVKGSPQPLNKIRVLEGSDGKTDNGKHMRAKFTALYGTVDRASEDELFAEPDPLFLHEFDIKIKVAGLGKDVQRDFFPGNNKEPLTKEVLLLPRYNLTEWLTPWPEDMLQRLVDGEDYNELIKEYKIVRFPRLMNDEAEF